MHRITPALVALVLVLAACGSGDSDATQTAPPTDEPSDSPAASPSFDPELLDRRWTILFAGTDLNAAREERNDPVSTDALMLVSLSDDQSRLAMVSLPRDTVDVPLPGGETYPRKINGLYREEGIGALVEAMEALFEVTIDAHVVLDMDDFTRLVDAVGGVEVSPAEPLEDPIVDLDLDPGPQEIDAVTANGYVRTRVDQDYGRMGRQQEVLLAIIERMVDPGRSLDLSALADSLDSLETDLPLDALPTLLELARRATDADLERLLIRPPLITFEGDRNDGRGYILEADVEAIRDEVRDLIAD
ncbi:MAG TPA: LCP family protein [Candidatus Angelobacter sp.]|nr:LCP family protein [Candidatus Angelobacter sp.]